MNHFWKELWRRFQPKLQFSSAHYPWTDSQTEVVNRTLGNVLHCVAEDRPKQRHATLPQVEFAFNSMVNRFTGKAPFEIIYTKPPNQLIDLLSLPRFHSKLAATLAEQIQALHHDVHTKLEVANTCYKNDVDRNCQVMTLRKEN